MGVSIGNRIVFSRGNRYNKTTELCPKCNSMLYVDKMSFDGLTYKCLRCNYTEIRRENNETVSDNHESSR